MKIRIVGAMSLLALLCAGCVSPQSQQALDAYSKGCAAGDKNACLAANNQAIANQQEQAQSTAVANSIFGAILQGAAQGVAEGLTAPQPVYVVSPVYRHR